MPLIVSDDVERPRDALRPFYALYFGGMGAKGENFHANVPIRMGYEAEADKIQDLYLDGKKDEAAAAIPTELIEQLSLVGPGEDPRRPRGVARVDRHDAARRRRRGDAAHGRRARARLSGPPAAAPANTDRAAGPEVPEIHGECDRRFAELRSAFETNFRSTARWARGWQ